MNRSGIRFLLTTLALVVLPVLAFAGVVIHVSPDGNDANDGLTWATAKKTIGAALAAAAVNPLNPASPTRIYIVGRQLDAEGRVKFDGVYRESLTINAKHKIELYGGFSGTEDTTAFHPNDNDIRSGGETVIDAQKLGRCFRISNSESVRLDRLCLTRGQVYGSGASIRIDNCQDVELRSLTVKDSSPSAVANGGGLYALNSTLKMKDCLFLRCTTAGLGGGAAILSGYAELENVRFEECVASGGGALLLDGPDGKVEHCTFRRNTATHLGGGGILMRVGARVDISASWFSQNRAGMGAAIFFRDRATTIMANCVISRNVAATGALAYADSGTDGLLYYSTIAENVASNGASALYVASGARVRFFSCVLAYNSGSGAIGRDSSASRYEWGTNAVWENQGGALCNPRDWLPGLLELDPGFLCRSLVDHPLSYIPRPESAILDLTDTPGNLDYSGARRPVAVRVPEKAWPDLGAFESQGWFQQRVELTNWRGPDDDPASRDQSARMLRVRVLTPDGDTIFDDFVPQADDGLYYLPGASARAGTGPYKVLISAPGYLASTVSDSGATGLLSAFPADGCTGVPLVRLIGGDVVEPFNVVDIRDCTVVWMAFGRQASAPSNPGTDIDGNGVTDVRDLAIVLMNFSETSDD